MQSKRSSQPRRSEPQPEGDDQTIADRANLRRRPGLHLAAVTGDDDSKLNPDQARALAEFKLYNG